MSKFVIVAGAALAGALTLGSSAENINIDMNSAAGGLVPAATYAAAGNAGVWNSYSGGGITSVPLLDLSGALTDVTITSASGIYSSTSLGYTGDLAALFNDVLDSTPSITIANLNAGTYNIWTYASDPDVPTTAGTNITIGGVTQSVIGPAVAGGTLILGAHYALHTVVHGGGSLVITVADLPGGNGFWNVNGLQIAVVPAPGALALLGLAGLVGSRRRRR